TAGHGARAGAGGGGRGGGGGAPPPAGEPLFPEEMVTDRAERFLAAELVREQAFLLLEDELPYAVAVTIERWAERPAQKDVVIDATIHVERDSQKRIGVGEGGRMGKASGSPAPPPITTPL